MVQERDINRLLPSEPREVQAWYKQERDPNLTTEYSSGRRFVVLFQFDPDSPTETGEYPSYLPTPGAAVSSVGHFIPPAEVSTTQLPVSFRKVQKALVYDKKEKRSINLVDLLPEGYDIRLVELNESLSRLFKAHGIDVALPQTRQRFSRGMPIGTYGGGVRIIDVPIFRFYQDTPEKRDAFAEQTVYTIGQARAVSRGTEGYMTVELQAQDFLRQTLTGKLYLLGDFPVQKPPK